VLIRALLLLACLYCLLFLGIGGVGMLGPDEPRYAAIGREMALSGDWVTPRLWGEPWFEKPPLLYWMTAAGWKLGLRDEWAARLPLALMSLGFLIWLRKPIGRQFGAEAGNAALAMVACSAGWLAYSAVGVTDVPLAVCFGMAVLLAAPWRERISWWAGVWLGLAMLAKGLVPLVLAVPMVWFWRRKPGEVARTLAVAIAVSAPWYVACYQANGSAFVNEFIIRQHFGRFLSGELQHVQPSWYYIPVLLGLLAPVTPLLMVLRRRVPETDFLLATAAFGFLFFSASTNKLPGYLMPILPLICAAAGVAWAKAIAGRWALVAAAGLAGLIPVAARVLPVALEGGLGSARWEMGWTWLAPLVAMAITALLVTRHPRIRERFPMVLLMGVAAAVAYVKITAYPLLDRQVSARMLWRGIEPRANDVCLDRASRDLQYGLAYYAGKPLPDCAVEPKAYRVAR
jgi:4-amino-4-deoxy-L-arabinose transferase-like glycosyltransferase